MGTGKIWIIDLLFNGNRMDQASKKLEVWFSFDFAVKISPNYVQFVNALRYGDMKVSLKEIMPRSMIKHYDEKTKCLVDGYCRAIIECNQLSYSFPVCLLDVIFSFYPPFF